MNKIVAQFSTTLLNSAFFAEMEKRTSKLKLWINQILLERKPWPDFFSNFNVPSNWSYDFLEKRIGTSLIRFRSNYIIMFYGVSAYGILHSWTCVFTFVIVSIWYFFVLFVSSTKQTMFVGDYEVSEDMKNVIWAIVAALMFFATGSLEIMFVWFCFSVIVCILHAIFFLGLNID